VWEHERSGDASEFVGGKFPLTGEDRAGLIALPLFKRSGVKSWSQKPSQAVMCAWEERHLHPRGASVPKAQYKWQAT